MVFWILHSLYISGFLSLLIIWIRLSTTHYLGLPFTFSFLFIAGLQPELRLPRVSGLVISVAALSLQASTAPYSLGLRSDDMTLCQHWSPFCFTGLPLVLWPCHGSLTALNFSPLIFFWYLEFPLSYLGAMETSGFILPSIPCTGWGEELDQGPSLQPLKSTHAFSFI